MKYTRKTVLALIDSMGCTFDACDDCDMIADSPAGKVFACNGGHSIVEPCECGRFSKAQAWQQMGEQLEQGLYDCDTPNCDICEERAENA